MAAIPVHHVLHHAHGTYSVQKFGQDTGGGHGAVTVHDLGDTIMVIIEGPSGMEQMAISVSKEHWNQPIQLASDSSKAQA